MAAFLAVSACSSEGITTLDPEPQTPPTPPGVPVARPHDDSHGRSAADVQHCGYQVA